MGHALLKRVESEVRDRGGRLLVIETSASPAYAPARMLYESSGYRREAIVRDFYAPSDDLVVYAKGLDDGGEQEPLRFSPALTSGGLVRPPSQ